MPALDATLATTFSTVKAAKLAVAAHAHDLFGTGSHLGVVNHHGVRVVLFTASRAPDTTFACCGTHHTGGTCPR